MEEQHKEFITEGKEILEREWCYIIEQISKDQSLSFLKDEPLCQAISRSINSNTKTYRYVLPTQILAKLTDSAVDSRCLQVAKGGTGAFDARSLCHSVIVPFDKDNDFVLGGSPEPYVNNPLRQPEVSLKYRNKQKDKNGWDDLCLVLEAVEKQNAPDFTIRAFRQVLLEIYKRLSEISVIYPVPKRISQDRCLSLIKKYISEQSGGDRVLAITSALFLTVGKRFNLFAEVKREKINASDAASGLAADIECISERGEIVLGIEVKDRSLTVNQIKDKLPGMRAKNVTEFLFIAQGMIEEHDRPLVDELVNKEFVSGYNIYIFDLMDFTGSILALLGEAGRRQFLESVGIELDKYRSALNHRRAWKNLLSEI